MVVIMSILLHHIVLVVQCDLQKRNLLFDECLCVCRKPIVYTDEAYVDYATALLNFKITRSKLLENFTIQILLAIIHNYSNVHEYLFYIFKFCFTMLTIKLGLLYRVHNGPNLFPRCTTMFRGHSLEVHRPSNLRKRFYGSPQNENATIEVFDFV